MPTKKSSRRKQKEPVERDSVYFLKLAIYAVLGLTWIHFSEPLHLGNFTLFGVPAGFVIGLIIASHDHFQVDRKIEYAILLLATVIGFAIPILGIWL